MLTVINGKVIDNLKWVAKYAVRDVLGYIQSILLSLIVESVKLTRVEACTDILIDTDIVFKMDGDDYNTNEIIKVIEMCSMFGNDYIQFLTSPDPKSEDRMRLLHSILWFLSQIGEHYEGFDRACIDEIYSIIKSTIKTIEIQQHMMTRLTTEYETSKKDKDEVKKINNKIKK